MNNQLTEKQKAIVALNSYNLRPNIIAGRLGLAVEEVEEFLAKNNLPVKRAAPIKKVYKRKDKPEICIKRPMVRPPAVYSNHRPYDF